MKAMIFAAGLGTRLKPLTDTMPKALVPLAGKPLLQWQVERLREAGIRDIIVNVHHFPDMIIDSIRANNDWGCHITVSDEREQLLETGGGLRKAWDGKAPIMVCNVDILQQMDDAQWMMDCEECRLVVSARDTQRYLCFNGEGYLCGWTNIKTGEVRGRDGQHLAYSGTAVLTPAIYPYLDRVAAEKGDKFSLIDLYLAAAQDGLKIKAYVPHNYRMMDVGKIDEIKQAEEFAQQLQDAR